MIFAVEVYIILSLTYEKIIGFIQIIEGGEILYYWNGIFQ